MSLVTIGAAAVGGAVLGSVAVRPLVFAYARPAGQAAATCCPGCGQPVLAARPQAFAALVSARCPSCSSRIGPPRGVAEAVTAAVFGGLVLAGAGGWMLAAQLWIALLGVALALIDLTVFRLPDHLTAAAAAGVALLLAGATLTGQPAAVMVRAVLGVIALSVLFFALALADGVAWGDFKVIPSLAALLAWHSWYAVTAGMVAGILFAALQGAVMLLTGRAKWGNRTRLALGPALIAGAIAASAVLS